MTLSPENRALVERVTMQPDSASRGLLYDGAELNRLLDAAREDGRRSVVDQHLVENGEAFYVVKGNVTKKVVGDEVVGISTFTQATAEELLARNKRASDRLGEAIAELRRRWPEEKP